MLRNTCIHFPSKNCVCQQQLRFVLTQKQLHRDSLDLPIGLTVFDFPNMYILSTEINNIDLLYLSIQTQQSIPIMQLQSLTLKDLNPSKESTVRQLSDKMQNQLLKCFFMVETHRDA